MQIHILIKNRCNMILENIFDAHRTIRFQRLRRQVLKAFMVHHALNSKIANSGGLLTNTWLYTSYDEKCNAAYV